MEIKIFNRFVNNIVYTTIYNKLVWVKKKENDCCFIAFIHSKNETKKKGNTKIEASTNQRNKNKRKKSRKKTSEEMTIIMKML